MDGQVACMRGTGSVDGQVACMVSDNDYDGPRLKHCVAIVMSRKLVFHTWWTHNTLSQPGSALP